MTTNGNGTQSAIRGSESAQRRELSRAGTSEELLLRIQFMCFGTDKNAFMWDER
jgi:hypothetical protein